MESVDKLALIRLLEEVADLLELQEASPFRIRAYRRAARVARDLPTRLEELMIPGRLEALPGIGAGLAEEIRSWAATGRLPAHAELSAALPPGVPELFRLPGIGPQKVRTLVRELGVTSLGELEYACRENHLVTLPGFGAKTQARVLEAIARRRRFRGQVLLPEARAAVSRLRAALHRCPGVDAVTVAGSVRRHRETHDRLELVAATTRPEEAVRSFLAAAGNRRARRRPQGRVEVSLAGGLDAVLHCVPPSCFGAALILATGSEEHLAALRARAAARGLEFAAGVLHRDGKALDCPSEEDFYAALDLPWIPPELREGGDEVALAAGGRLPRLVQQGDLRGAFHVHTVASDGTADLRELVAAARGRGWEYLGICDHSASAGYANGLDAERVRRQWREIDALNAEQAEVRLFKGIESDVRADGSLDYPEELLAGFDFVIASIHSRFGLDRDQQTERLLRAVAHPRTTMLGHLTGRLLLARDGYALDAEAVIAAAVARGVMIELNASPQRLDVDWRLLPMIKAAGGKVAVNPDAHSLAGLDDVAYGVGCARKGGLEAADVFNTRDAAGVAAAFARRRGR